jgi:deoxyribodipyrimidine photo-lyase
LDYSAKLALAIQSERLKPLNNRPGHKGQYVIYWMQASQRTEYNHALEYSILKANELSQPLVVYFGLTREFPEANSRHYHFMLEGLKEVQSSLEDRKILLVIQTGFPPKGVFNLAKQASMVVVDRGYLKVQRDWRQVASLNIECPLMQVESDIVVPVEEASPKEEYSAATFRPKITGQLAKYLKPLYGQIPKYSSLGIDFSSLKIEDVAGTIAGLKADAGAAPVKTFRGGASEAEIHLNEFLTHRLHRYPEERNDPDSEVLSNLSPYLHFGQISPLYVALKTIETGGPGSDAFLEELVIRRELGCNYAVYNPDYDSFRGLPAWAQRTLNLHLNDRREITYSLADFENARTHDKYWNAAQREMLYTGKMHGYMRMYWGKKILEWTETPEEAFKIALYLNNKYELDGRDPNGFAGISWCFGKHDRPWSERAIFGNIRYMNENGLKRKFDADKYAAKTYKI